MPADLDELVSAIDATCRLRGRFTLRSGIVAEEYFDKYRFEGDPQLLRRVAERMVPLLPADSQSSVASSSAGCRSRRWSAP